MNVEEPVQPGDIFNVELTVQCDGADSYDVMTTVSFDNSGSISPLSPTLVSLGDIMEGETHTVTYQLLVKGDIKAGQYPMMFTAMYTNSKGMPTSLVETLTIMVEGLIDFQLIDIPHIGVLRGGEAELEADLLLVGTESVEFVSIDVVEDAFIKRVKGSEEYIGAVDPDSPIPFDISFKIDDEAETGEHDITLNVRYRDHLNKQHETSLEIPVEILEGEIESPTGGRNGGIWVWIRRLLGLN
jgi:hypothetical protein